MDERNDDEQKPQRRPSEGVRIIGAEEAQAAIDAGHAAGKRPEDAPKYGDVPRQPEGPRPAIRFPLGGATDPSSVPRPGLSHAPGVSSSSGGQDAPDSPKARDGEGEGEREREREREEPTPSIWAPPPPAPDPMSSPADEPPVITPPGGRTELPHWTEPPTGENPRIGGDGDDDLAAWQATAASGPRWRGEQASDWDDVDTHDPTTWADEEGRRMGALDPDTGVSDLYRFDEPYNDDYEPVPAGAAAAGPARAPADDASAGVGVAPGAEPVPPRRIDTRMPPPEPPAGGPARRAGVGRDVPTAIVTGLGIAAVLLILLRVFENVGGLVIATVVLTIAAAEFFNALRVRGFRPATLLGVAGTAAISWGAYARGEQAVVLITGLFAVFALLWYLLGVSETTQPTANAGASILGFTYIGVLGATAALLLKWPPNHAHGMGLFLGAVIATVAYDVGGFAIGSRAGRTPLAPEISPNKTWEGLIGGMAAAFLASIVIVTQIQPWDFKNAFALGLVAAVAAPLGDLCESMLKRDLGVKDMGSVLPGHGGVLDRIDAMLFVIPAVYYLAKLLEIGY
jgi:phosphatidate cytidylyltransferase